MTNIRQNAHQRYANVGEVLEAGHKVAVYSY